MITLLNSCLYSQSKNISWVIATKLGLALGLRNISLRTTTGHPMLVLTYSKLVQSDPLAPNRFRERCRYRAIAAE
jgi:hypothetical protein